MPISNELFIAGSRPMRRVTVLDCSSPEILQRPALQPGAPLFGARAPSAPAPLPTLAAGAAARLSFRGATETALRQALAKRRATAGRAADLTRCHRCAVECRHRVRSALQGLVGARRGADPRPHSRGSGRIPGGLRFRVAPRRSPGPPVSKTHSRKIRQLKQCPPLSGVFDSALFSPRQFSKKNSS